MLRLYQKTGAHRPGFRFGPRKIGLSYKSRFLETFQRNGNDPRTPPRNLNPLLFNPRRRHRRHTIHGVQTIMSLGKQETLLLFWRHKRAIKLQSMSLIKLTNRRPGRYVAIDCEMVGVGTNGTEDVLARVSIVNYYGNVLLDTFVSPAQRVTDWRTKHSGIRPADVLNSEGTAPEIMLNLAKSFDVVQKEVMELLKDRVIIGHALKGDLAALKLSHPRYAIRDTSSYEPFRTKYGSGRTPSLKKIVQGELGVDIQISEHDSVSPH